MLGDKELEGTNTQLEDYLSANKKQQETLTEVLQKYGSLIEEYKRLKSDYEEERNTRERYKQLAREQERNPFVLVLVDGDGYIFEDDLVSSKAEGGQKAAQLLNEAVLADLRARGLENCSIMVRVYTNLAGLSKALAKHGLCGHDARSLAPFAANFNRTNELFDFIDAGELKENADSKIRALFRQFIHSPQCQHIFFAGCHDVGYINELTLHINNREKITLVTNYATHPEFTKLGLRMTSFKGVFRNTSLDVSGARSHKSKVTVGNDNKNKNGIAPPTEPQKKLCQYYSKGMCNFGSKCNNLHVDANAPNVFAASPTKPPHMNAQMWRNPKEPALDAPPDVD